MNFFTYVVCWDNVHDNVLSIEKSLVDNNCDYKIINSGSLLRDNWDNVGDIRYYRQFYYALKDFDYSKDYMFFLCGDVSSQQWEHFYFRANSVINSFSPGLYAPHLTNEPWSENSSRLFELEEDRNLLVSIQTDGIAVFIHKDIVKVLLEFFNYLNKKIDLATISSGWGLDLIWCSISIFNQRIILRDKHTILEHPAGSSYNHGKASEEMTLLLNSFYDFWQEQSEYIRSIHAKIYGRMSHDPSAMNILDFYKVMPNIVYKQSLINYNIITVNDERIKNVNEIDAVLSSYNKLNIKGVYAKDESEWDNFINEYKDFKITWPNFKKGELGNFASHYKIWKRLSDSGMNSILVFEDDAVIDKNFVNKYNMILNSLPEDYDICSIYVNHNQHERYNNAHKVNYYVSTAYQDWSTLCYVISKKGAKAICDYVESNGMDMPTDWFIFRNAAQGKFKVYTVPPYFSSPVEIDHSYKSQVQ